MEMNILGVTFQEALLVILKATPHIWAVTQAVSLEDPQVLLEVFRGLWKEMKKNLMMNGGNK